MSESPTGNISDAQLAQQYQPGSPLGDTLRTENPYLNAQNRPNPAPQGQQNVAAPEIAAWPERLANAANQIGVLPGVGGWAKSLVASAIAALPKRPMQPIQAQVQQTPVQPQAPQSRVQQIASGIGSAVQNVTKSLGDAGAIGTVPSGGGALTGVFRTLGARNQRLSQEENDQIVHAESQARTIGLMRNIYRQDEDARLASYKQGADFMNQLRAEHDVEDNITQDELARRFHADPNFAHQYIVKATGEEQLFDANGKPMLDKNGNPVASPLYSIAKLQTNSGDRATHLVTAADSEYLERNAAINLPQGTNLNLAQWNLLYTRAHATQDAENAIQKANDDELSEENLRRLRTDLQDSSIQAYSMSVPGQPLAGLYQASNNVQAHLQDLNDKIAALQQKPGNEQANAALQQKKQRFIQEGGKIGRVITFGFNDAAKEKYADWQLKVQRQAEEERHNRADEENKRQAEANKRQADINDNTDAFGNRSALSDKEFNKRYDSFTNSAQNKTLQTLQGSYQQFQHIIGDLDSGKDMTGAQSVVGLFNAIGISAVPLAGKGFRINNNTVEEHVGARGLDQVAIQKLAKLKNGDVISPQQLKDYANIALDVYKSAYVNAANEQLRTLGYTDVLPRGNNQPIDPVTHEMYLRIAGGNVQRATTAEQKQGWAVQTPQVSGLTNLHTNGKQTIGWNGTQWVDATTGKPYQQVK